MLYSLHFSIDGIIGPGGEIRERQEELIGQAVVLAKTAVDLLGDWVHDADWFDASGEPSDVLSIFDTEDDDELIAAVGQISDAMKSQRLGFIDFHAHDDLFALIDYHSMLEWISPSMRARILEAKRICNALKADLSFEWSAA
jgi:hypothetical protein